MHLYRHVFDTSFQYGPHLENNVNRQRFQWILTITTITLHTLPVDTNNYNNYITYVFSCFFLDLNYIIKGHFLKRQNVFLANNSRIIFGENRFDVIGTS